MTDDTPSPASRTRASRRSRVRGRALKLRERDIDILLALAKMRLLRTSDLGELYFDAKGTCQKRLRKLYDAGLIRAVVTDLAAENRYALTRLGHDFLLRALPEGKVPAFLPAPRVDGRSVAHLDLLNRYRVALARGAAERDVELVAFTAEWDLRAREPHAPLMPDATVRLRVGAATIGVAIEIDVGTEPPGLVRKKVEQYEAAGLQGVAVGGLLRPVVLIVTATARRARSIGRALTGASAPSVLVGSVPWVLENGGLGIGLAKPEELAQLDAVPDRTAFGRGLRRLADAARSVREGARPFGSQRRSANG